LWKKAVLLLPQPIALLIAGTTLLAWSDGSRLVNSLGLLAAGFGLMNFSPSPLTNGGRFFWELYAFARRVRLTDEMKKLPLVRIWLATAGLWLGMLLAVCCIYPATVNWLRAHGIPVAVK
jgi:hypothetical protein